MLYIHLFGRLQLNSEADSWLLAVRPKTISLLAFLLLNRTRATSRTALAALLWPDQTEGKARSDLRRHLYDLEQALPTSSNKQRWILRTSDTLRWNPESDYWLDVADFERLCDSSPLHLAKAVTLYTAPLLPQIYEDWLVQERSRLDQLYLSNLRRLIAHAFAQGQLAQAIDYARQALKHDPLLEDVSRDLMRLYSESGRRPEALQTYKTLQQRLQADLGVSPAEETLALFESIANGMAVAIPQSAARLPRVIEHNLPASLTSFVGREEMIAAIHRKLTSPSTPVRLLTLIGPPGAGKTRLALEVGRRLLNHQPHSFPDGLFFVDLSAVTIADQVPVEIAGVLHITPSNNQSLLETLKAHLRGRYTLLILDNFEQVLEAALAVGELLASAPQLYILVTSRTSLKLYGEQEFPIPPLALPERGDVLPLHSLRAVESVALFESRAQQRQPAFVIDDDNSADVAEICFQLDGLPLALELAAGLIQTISPAAMVQQMGKRLSFLTSDLRDRPERQQTLRAAIAWSYDRLNTSEQQLLGELAVFAGGWSLEAAQAVCNAVSSYQLSDNLAVLIERSLIQPVAGMGGERYRLLAVIREFALEQLVGTPANDKVYQRHANYFADLAEAIEKQWYGENINSCLVQLRLEEDNLRAALGWALAEAQTGNNFYSADRTLAGVRLAMALNHYWKVRGRLDEGRAWLMRAMTYREHLSIERQVNLIKRLASFMQRQADYSAAQAVQEEALDLARQSEDSLLIGKVLHDLGTLAGVTADYSRAEQLLAESAALQREISAGVMTDNLAYTLNNLAIVYMYLGDNIRAASLLEEILVFHRANKAEIEIGATLTNLGNLALMQTAHVKAKTYYSEALQLLHALDDQIDLCDLFPGVAALALAQGSPARSAKLHGISQNLIRELNYNPPVQVQERFERDQPVLRQLLGERQYETLVAEGAAMTLAEAVAFALVV